MVKRFSTTLDNVSCYENPKQESFKPCKHLTQNLLKENHREALRDSFSSFPFNKKQTNKQQIKYSINYLLTIQNQP